ncbi:sigma-54-dependent transcriptional regulator [Acidaminobacter hydrogenoformans]|uniref:Stage 0 sporulation protein A homolog n=1 Tax=Acidaminobacter hydrogenoformans DSM 2784 TaxID=1120920 RepID=A0A1G5RV48_9FIRM|nr:sigma-54 dependent transcriptional regulator [Acidaminobacter hydrogenoformans]SCZ77982.1 two-component system, NtrC family, response regulator AtoC [Acidaminobacter hydrogenoformans DSM 2784]
MKEKILIIDDEADICSSLCFLLEDKYDVKSTVNPALGLAMIQRETFHLVLLDLKIGTVDGINVLGEIKKIDASIQVIIMTAFGSIVSSVDAIKKGAYTYLTKPLNLVELEEAVEEALNFRKSRETVEYGGVLDERFVYQGIIGQSPSMKKIFELIDKLKDVDTSVVITGESGTGKELVAKAIHEAGRRRQGNFVEINCAAIPESLLEEELFGHKKGTFTGAMADKIGKFEYANNGTIFLDEIGDMPVSLQAKLLRVLQQREYTPLGGHQKVRLNIRVIAATHQDLKKMVEDGRFRQDLYFRLNVVEINLPSLRDRRQDLPLLFAHFLMQYNKEMRKQVKGFSKEAEACLLGYDYPGNVRELSNIIECAVLLAREDVIEVENLPVEVRANKTDLTDTLDLALGARLGTESLVGLTLQDAERKLISAALVLNKGHRKATAAMLGISERGLRNKINDYGLNE